MTPAPRRICLIGEAMIELSAMDCAANVAQIGVAGDTYNTAVHLARSLPASEWTVEYVTLLGQDALSAQIIAQMQAEGVSTRLVGRHPERLPGLYAIELDDKGERSFRYWRSQSAARALFAGYGPDLTALEGAEAVFLSLITLAILPDTVRAALIAKLASLRAKGCLIAFDSNYRPNLWNDAEEARSISSQMWAVTQIALPSRDDEQKLWPAETVDQTLARLAGFGVPEIALKNGADGPALWQNGPLPCGPFAPAGRVVDTSGAGDAFNAGYLAARLRTISPKDAAQAGHSLALHVIGQRGALPKSHPR